ncbi:MAG TPA: tripartite tricarboxylate transporter substrate binding protein [Ramlibacter sp.]|nr:tripartite tricarboxylate transporter substrate binding protein [Ramlibacter sp.]
MDLPRRSILAALGAAPLTLVTGRNAAAQGEAFPSRPVRLLVGFPAGGALDLTARAIAQRLAERLGQPVVVENRPGATGTIATAALAKSPPDGHTLLLVSSAHAANASTMRSLPYDTLADFEPVILASVATPVLVVHPSVKAATLQEFVGQAKARPGALHFYSSGVGSASHMSATLFAGAAGIELRHVPYKGTAEAVRDLVGGEVQLAIDSITALLPFIRDGRLRPLAVGTRTRSPLLPEIPTFEQAGLPGFSVYSWGGILAPAKTPAAVVRRLNSELNVVLQASELRAQLDGMGTPAQGGTPEAFDQLIRSEVARFAKVVAAAGGPTP